MKNVLLIDNFDSFTFNLVDALERLGCRVQVVRNTVKAAEAMASAAERNALIVLSPGPGRPEDAGCCLELVSLARGKIPLLGVCLGHQAIAIEDGGQLARAAEPVHGKSSLFCHDGAGPFKSISCPLRVGRYHSLYVRDLPLRFHVHGEIDGMAMAISDPTALQVGVQFHPESILTSEGDRLLSAIVNGRPGGRRRTSDNPGCRRCWPSSSPG